MTRAARVKRLAALERQDRGRVQVTRSLVRRAQDGTLERRVLVRYTLERGVKTVHEVGDKP